MTTRRGEAARPLPKRTREALAACQAIGLHYWADHPQAHHLWAVDDHQQAHAVRVSRRDGTAQHVCRPELLVEACSCDDDAVPYTAPENEDRSPGGRDSLNWPQGGGLIWPHLFDTP